MRLGLFIVFAVLTALIGHARADASLDGLPSGEGKWLQQKQEIKDLLASRSITDQDKCNKVWDILWSEAKSGNLPARAWIRQLVFPYGPHSDTIALPGRSGDYISQMRDAIILSVHTTGVKLSNDKETAYYNGFSRELYSEVKLEYVGGPFLNCVSQPQSNNCVNIAVKRQLVPSFESYASEVDLLLSQHKSPTCFFNRESIPSNR